ncbi:MAG: hypothetical protein RL748_4581 [Pseudomonadota bacterium]|jgi:hypothetical protein
MDQILTTLDAARTLLRSVGTANAYVSFSHAQQDDILLTLLFYKLVSDAARQRVKRFARFYPESHTTRRSLHLNNYISCTEACFYETCIWATPNAAGLALQRALNRWCQAQSNSHLTELLRPQRFGRRSGYPLALTQSGILAQVITLIGTLDFCAHAPGRNMGDIFNQALASLGIAAAPLPDSVMQLMWTLLAPRPTDTIYDPACGNGPLLLACAGNMTQRLPDSPMIIYGQEANTEKWALAKMRLLTQGLMMHQLDNSDALQQAMEGAQRYHLRIADVVMLHLERNAPDWQYESALHLHQHCFHCEPPRNRQIALIWQALACLKDRDARVGIVLPLRMLAGSEGLVLRRYLVEHWHLVALIELPKIKQQGQALHLLVLRQYYAFDAIAFISSKTALPDGMPPEGGYDFAAIEHAWTAFKQHQYAPYLRVVDAATIKAHQWQFHLSAYENCSGPARLPGYRG